MLDIEQDKISYYCFYPIKIENTQNNEKFIKNTNSVLYKNINKSIVTGT